MTEEEIDDLSGNAEGEDVPEEKGMGDSAVEELKKALDEANDKYVRLYADFENYKKITARNKEELLKYANRDIISDILTVVDHLELALQHTRDNGEPDSLAEGVQLTLKELMTVLEKYGVATIDSLGKPFDPSVHHAMTQIESEDAEEHTVVKEFRKGYMLKERVIRAALVGVAVKPSGQAGSDTDVAEDQTGTEDD